MITVFKPIENLFWKNWKKNSLIVVTHKCCCWWCTARHNSHPNVRSFRSERSCFLPFGCQGPLHTIKVEVNPHLVTAKGTRCAILFLSCNWLENPKTMIFTILGRVCKTGNAKYGSQFIFIYTAPSLTSSQCREEFFYFFFYYSLVMFKKEAHKSLWYTRSSWLG